MSQHEDDATIRLVRETLHERSADVGTAPPPLAAAPPARRVMPGARPALVAATAAGVVALAVAGVAGWRAQSPSPAARPAPVAVATSTPAPDVPAGWKPVASLGVQIWVPGDWPVRGAIDEGCEKPGPGGYLVSRPIGTAPVMRCPAMLGAGTLVIFHPGLLSGVPSRSSTEGRVTLTWVSPDRTATVVASGPDEALLQQVIDTARTVDVDALGCPTDAQRPDWDRRRDGLPPVRLAGPVTEIAACVYQGDRLAGSGVLDAAQRLELAAALEPAAFVAAPDGTSYCRAGREEQSAILRVRTAAAVSLLAVHWGGCTDRYVATAGGQSGVSTRVVRAVLEPLGAHATYAAPIPRG